jgi:hypothetical protein
VTTPPVIEIASQVTIRRLCAVPGATSADDSARTPRYVPKAKAIATVERGRLRRVEKRPPARRTAATAAIAGISSRIVPMGVSSVTRESEARRKRITRARRGRDRAVAPAASAPTAARMATRGDESGVGHRSYHQSGGPHGIVIRGVAAARMTTEAATMIDPVADGSIDGSKEFHVWKSVVVCPSAAAAQSVVVITRRGLAVKSG